MSDADDELERDLAGLKKFTRMAEEDYRQGVHGTQRRLLQFVDRIDEKQSLPPPPDAAGSNEVRWEIYSTWMLLLCLHHTEAEAQRSKSSFKSEPWKTEAQGLRRVFLRHRSARILAAILRWLRWSHRWGPRRTSSEDKDEAIDGGDASYERTRRALQLRSAIPQPFQAEPALHPDGPLQRQECFDHSDLEDERRLLRDLFVHLRRGELGRALELCGSRGQAWRTALLQGMMAFDDDCDEPIGYDAMADDAEEELLAKIKEEHSDWTEFGVLEGSAKSQGNPWRRLWKEQCWDTAQRNLKPGSAMDLYELSMYGFCAGHHEALLAVSAISSWADRCWAEFHCLKEWLVERLLDIEREVGIQDLDLFPGEGDGGMPDAAETTEDRAARKQKLCGYLHDVESDQIERIVASEAKRLFLRLREDPSAPPQLRQEANSSFALLQAKLIEAAWEREHLEDALGMLRSWLEKEESGKPCPFLLKQFASYFAMWLKDHSTPSSVPGPEPPAAPPPQIDDIVRTHVGDLVSTASTSWIEQCLEGHAIELIAQHVKALEMNSRISTFVTLLLELGRHVDRSVDTEEELRGHVLVRCFSVYWTEFPEEVFELVGAVVRKALGLKSESAEAGTMRDDTEPEDMEGEHRTGVLVGARPEDLDTAIRCLAALWRVTRDKDKFALCDAIERIDRMIGFLPEVDPEATCDQLARYVLEVVVMPCLIDCLLCFAVKDVDSALPRFFRLQESPFWDDCHSAGGVQAEFLSELEWYFKLTQRRNEWSSAFESGKAESSSREALLDWARMRLARDKPLLKPEPGSLSNLQPGQWENLQRTLASRVLFSLLSMFEQVHDFDGAAQDLAVAVAQSPWMLSLIRPELLRAFLQRVALIPTSLRGFNCLEPERPAALGWGPNLLEA